MNPRLGVCIDHLAALRDRGGQSSLSIPFAAQLIGSAGAHQIIAHLREDKQGVSFEEAKAIREKVDSLHAEFILAIAPTSKMVSLAIRVAPHAVCLVSEGRKFDSGKKSLELTKDARKVKKAVTQLKKAQISVNLLISLQSKSVRLAQQLGLDGVELDASVFAKSTEKAISKNKVQKEIEKIRAVATVAKQLMLKVQIGNGLNSENVRPLIELLTKEGAILLDEYHIGHSVIARAALVGLERAVRETVSAILAP